MHPAPAAAIDLGGTVRAADPAATIARARRVLAPLGITRVANVTGLDHVGVPTWMAVRPLARSLTVSQGKGLTDALAWASAVMECIELHHAEHFVPRGHVETLSAAARDARYADPLLLPIRPDVKFDENSAVEWVAGVDLFSGTPRFVPRDCIDLDSVSARERGKLFVGSSNGLASGNTKTEAMLHALCEVIERDHETLWYLRRQFGRDGDHRRLQLDSVADRHCRWLLERVRAAGLEISVWHTAQELGIPSFMCTVFDRHANTFYPQRATGSGCHPYRRIALSRAITEALQSRLTHIAGGRDDMYWSLYRDRLRVDDEAGRDWSSVLAQGPVHVAYEDVPEMAPAPSIDALLASALASLREAGFAQAIVVDLTQGWTEVPVVHVTVPGLEGHVTKEGYTPGPRARQIMKERK